MYVGTLPVRIKTAWSWVVRSTELPQRSFPSLLAALALAH